MSPIIAVAECWFCWQLGIGLQTAAIWADQEMALPITSVVGGC